MKAHFQKQSNLFRHWIQTVFVLMLGIVGHVDAQSPGGVSANLKVWLKADDGFTPSVWTNKAVGGVNYTQTNAAKQPVLLPASNRFNFNPGVDFGTTAAAGTNGKFMVVPTGGPYSADGLSNSMFLLINKNGDPAGFADYWGFNCATCGNGAASYAANLGVFTGGSAGAFSYYPYAAIPAAQTQMKAYAGYSAIQDLSYIIGGDVSYANNSFPYVVNVAVTAANSQTASGSVLGAQAEASMAAIPEVIGYERELTATEKLQVRSYLAIKYGVTLGDNTTSFNYLSSTGAAVWTGNATYQNDITGIARDDNSALYQKQSLSINSGKQVLIGAGGAVANTNALNSNTLANGQYLVCGNNGLSKSLSVPTTAYGATVNNRFAAIWKVQNTGAVGTVRVMWAQGILNLKLIQSSDAVFDATDVLTDMSANTQVVNGVTYNYADVTLGNGTYFTFAGFGTGPGGVVSDLTFWLKGDANVTTSGNQAQTWQDTKAGVSLIRNTAATTGEPLYSNATGALRGPFNFKPYVSFKISSDMVASGIADQLYTTPGVASFFQAYAPKAAAEIIWSYRNSGTAASQVTGEVKGGSMGLYSDGYAAALADVEIVGKPYISGLTRNGDGTKTVSPHTGYFNGNYGTGPTGRADPGDLTAANAVNTFSIGSGNNTAPHTGDVAELMLFNRQVTQAEAVRIMSYLAIKYGRTLNANSNGTGQFDYVGANNEAIWTGIANATFHNQVAGLARADISSLMTLKSQGASWVSSAGEFDNLIVSTSAITTDNSYLMWGNNGGTGATAFAANACTALLAGTATHRTNAIWRFQETGTLNPVKLEPQGLASMFNINSSIYMEVSSSATFATTDEVLLVTLVNGQPTVNYDFKGTKYVRFLGTQGGNCITCNGAGTILQWKTVGWTTGANSKTGIVLSNGLTADVNFPLNGITEYLPTLRPNRRGNSIQIDRWDNSTASYTPTITLSKAALASFQLYAIDRWGLNVNDIVEVRGYCGGGLVTPNMTNAYPTAIHSYTIAGNKATGNKYWSGYDYRWGKVNVVFDVPVDSIVIDWKVNHPRSIKDFQRIGIGDITFDCPTAISCFNDDKVYLDMKATSSGYKLCNEVRYEFKVANKNCVSKVVNIADVLPTGMVWADSTFENGSLSTGVANAYSASSTFNLTGLTVPAGKTLTFYVSAKFLPTAVAGVFTHQATMTVNGGIAGTIVSDGSIADGCTPSSISVATGVAPPVPSITVAADKACYQHNDVVTYTVTLNNTSGAPITGALFEHAVQDNFIYVANSLSNAFGGTANYGGIESMNIEGMTIPVGVSTFTFQANAMLSDSTFTTTASISADPNSDCGTESAKVSNGIKMTACPPCVAGTTAPVITATTATNTCPALTVNLGSLANTGTKPAGTTLVWSTHKTPTSGADTLSNLSVGSGMYYALYRDKTNACFSTAADSVNVTAVICVNNPVTTPGPGSNVNGNAGTELVPAGGTAPYTYSNGSSDPLCVAPAGYTALPASSNLTVNASTGAYTYTAPSVPGNYYYCIKVCDSSTPAKCNVGVYKVNISGALPSLTTPAIKTPLPGGTDSGNAGTELAPAGGTAPYSYSNGSSDPLCVAPAGYTALPASSNLTVNASTGAYTYTAPTTAGKYYFCIKVCDSATPQNCNVATYKVENTPLFGGTPPVLNPPAGGASGGNAGTELQPAGGVAPYIYTDGSNEAGCTAPAAGYTLLPASSNLTVNSSTGAYTYTAPTTPGNYFFCIKVCDSSVPAKCNLATYKMTVSAATSGLLTAKVLLQGGMSGTAMTTTLNTLNLIPMTDPYGKGATTTSTILSSNSVTDWVLVELRSAPGTIAESIAVLVKNDGTLINPDGSTPLKFTTTSGNFYVAVRHRNHLGVMTATAIAISSSVQNIDFTSASTATYGTSAQATVGGGTLKAMWAGNAKGITLAGTDKVNYTGLGSSLSGIKTTIGSNLSLQVTGYLNADINLDGKVSYTGLGSDLSILKATLNSAAGGLNNIWNQTF